MMFRNLFRRLRARCASSLIEEARADGRRQGAHWALSQATNEAIRALLDVDVSEAVRSEDLMPNLDAVIEEAIDDRINVDVEPVSVCTTALDDILGNVSWDAFGVCSEAVEAEVSDMLNSRDGEISQAFEAAASAEAEAECDRWADAYSLAVVREIESRLHRVLRRALDDTIGDCSAFEDVGRFAADQASRAIGQRWDEIVEQAAAKAGAQ